MRIDGLGRTLPGGTVARAGERGSGFRLADSDAAATTRSATPLRAAPGLDALLALQDVSESPVERRKRAVRRGKGLLDALDDMKRALLDGRADAAALGELRSRFGAGAEPTGLAGLDETLAAIDLRVQVELAKRGV